MDDWRERRDKRVQKIMSDDWQNKQRLWKSIVEKYEKDHHGVFSQWDAEEDGIDFGDAFLTIEEMEEIIAEIRKAREEFNKAINNQARR